jgi:methylated-DNA-[protein]-cysteine S-methyltransferase
MEVREGACRFGLWWVHVAWAGDSVFRVRFSDRGEEGPVPLPLRTYLNGATHDLSALGTPATTDGEPFARIYRLVSEIPYGETATYGGIAARAGTSPRAVGLAMRRNPVPLVIPCHRVVAKDGIGGYSAGVEIKEALLALERRKKSSFV